MADIIADNTGKETIDPVKRKFTLQELAWGAAGGIAIDLENASITATVEPPIATETYAASDVDDAAVPNYYGFVDKNGAWYILQEDVSGGVTQYRYAKGSSDYATNWTNRAGLTYALFNEVF